MARRVPAVDTARGLAVLAMIVFHAAWFLKDQGLIAQDLKSWPWFLFQRSIASSFFLLVGVSQELAGPLAGRWGPFLRRQGMLLLFAGVVSGTSYLLDPLRWVKFGILHCIFVVSWLLLPLVGRPVAAAGLGLGLLALNALVEIPAWGHPMLVWTGLGPLPPPTFDWQPLLPWWGVSCLGLAVGARLAAAPPPFAGPTALQRIGQASLWIYMAHVPILQAMVFALKLALRG